jgi:hypothetical protein
VLSTSYISPFPQGDRYQVRVIGDYLAAGLSSGLEEAFKQEGTLQIATMSRPNYGLTRIDQTDLMTEIDRMLSGPPVNIAVIMMGINDRSPFRSGTAHPLPGTEDWKDAYAKEAEKIIKKLRTANIAVYWVGLPIMGNPALSDNAAAVNDAVRQAAYLNGAKYIETWSGFTDQGGAYSAYGPDLSGQTQRLREGDGIGLTAAGNRKLANYVEIVLRRDLSQARSQRNIPLAGDEEEQARLVPGTSKSANEQKGNIGPEAAQTLPAGSSPARPLGEPAGVGQSEQEASRREQAAFSGSAQVQQGEYILGDLDNGLTDMAVITAANEFSIREIQRQTPLADRAYFKVLSKGEALPAKEGRADDFRWQGGTASQSQ